MRSHDKIKTKYFLLNYTCGHKLGRMVTYNEENSPMMSHKNKISPLLQIPYPLNLAGWRLMIRETHP